MSTHNGHQIPEAQSTDIPALPQEPVLLEKMARVGVGSWDLRHAFELMTDEVAQLVEHDCAVFLTYHRDRRSLVLEAIAPIGATKLTRGMQIPVDGPISDLINGSLSAAVCMDTTNSCCTFECQLSEAGFKSCITIPLIVDSRLVGILSLGSREDGQFQSSDRAALNRLQRPLAVALQHVLSNNKQNTPRFFERSTELDHMRSVHELSGSIAHRLNNVFASVLGNARLALETNDDPNIEKYLQRLYEEGLEGTRVIRAMQQFAASQAPTSASKIDLHSVVEGVVEITQGLWRQQVETQRITLNGIVDREVACAALANAAELREATVNMVFNSIQALPDGGEINLRAKSEPPWAGIEVTDNGVGMDKETVRRCTEPFFTTRSDAYGLGLSIAAGVARKYGGHVQITSDPGNGTTVCMMLPAADHGV